MEIKVENYLSENEIKEICKQALYDTISTEYTYKLESILANIGYRALFAKIDKETGVDSKKIVKQKVIELLQSEELNGHYEIFRHKGTLYENNSPAVDAIEEIIKKHKGLIEKRVVEEINEYDFSDIKLVVEVILHDILEERLFGKNINKEE